MFSSILFHLTEDIEVDETSLLKSSFVQKKSFQDRVDKFMEENADVFGELPDHACGCGLSLFLCRQASEAHRKLPGGAVPEP